MRQIARDMGISDRSVRRIEKKELGLKPYKLHIEGNSIKILSSGPFLDLPNVTVLILMKNEIEVIHPGAFEGLNNLRWLLLRNNSLTDPLNMIIFEDIPFIEVFQMNSLAASVKLTYSASMVDRLTDFCLKVRDEIGVSSIKVMNPPIDTRSSLFVAKSESE
ncbi:hypothetical protein TNCV_1415571 [Trichonephila clavipes]|nr:hypothetical protein TNCV_1415571 [Trichonephila clavipes]